MVVAVIQKFVGATVEQYDQVLEKMGLRAGTAGPPGQLFHWAAATENGLLITDVWESAEQFQQWAEEKTGPLAASVGVTDPPTVTMHQVHAFLLPG